MLLSDNSIKVRDLLYNYDNLSDIDKIRLSIYLLENKDYSTDYNIDNFIKLLKEVLSILDPSYKTTITNFSKYKNLLILSSKYLELSDIEKKRYSIEMLFNIFQNDFKNEIINKMINKDLTVYDYYYSLFK